LSTIPQENIAERVKAIWLISNIHLFLENEDESYRWAKEAHELTKEIPSDGSHAYYLARATRTGHVDEALLESLEYKRMHPVITEKWMKEIKMPSEESGASFIDTFDEALGRSHTDYMQSERDFATKYGSKIDGLILSGTSGVNTGSKVGIGLCDSIALLLGDRYRSDIVYNTAFFNYNKNYKERFNQYDWLTRDNEVKSWYEKNDYCNFIFTLSAFRDMFTVLDRVSDDNWAYSLPFELPIFILAGDMDPVGEYGKGIEKVYKSICDSGKSNVRKILYPGARHEILNEKACFDTVCSDVVSWIEEIL
jgi:hypothetical protein